MNLNKLVGAASLVTGAVNIASKVGSFFSSSSESRLNAAGLLNGSEPMFGGSATAQFANAGPIDWRVKLSLPTSSAFSKSAAILAPMTGANGTGGLVFPFTPSIQISHSSNYNAIDPVHSNYQFLSYENSKVDAINISGQFYCEDAVEARYWVAAVHYLRSVTKMHFGESSDAGAPPPVVKLSGYGDYVFNNVPVVVKTFTVDLPQDVDYIATGLSGGDTGSATATKISYAPVKSTINVTVQPIYSREDVRKFSLDSFVEGKYVFNGKGFI